MFFLEKKVGVTFFSVQTVQGHCFLLLDNFFSSDPADMNYCKACCSEGGCCESLILYFQGKGRARKTRGLSGLQKKKKKKENKHQIKFASRRLQWKKLSLLKNLDDPSFVNLMQAEIASDDSIIRHHYQHQNVWPGADGSAASVTGWYGLHFANRPCPPLIFYACQSNTVMTACIAAE